MFLREILDNYGVVIPNDKYMLEYFIQSDSYQHCHIDIVPISIDYEKYRQVEVFYRKTINNTREKKQYTDFENSFKQVLTKMWLCSETFVGIDAIYPDFKKTKSIIEKPYKKYVSLFFQAYKSQEFKAVEQKEIMDGYSIIGLRNIANVVYYFKSLHILIFSNFSCLTVVFLKHDNSIYSVVKDIVNSEGLFLRKT